MCTWPWVHRFPGLHLLQKYSKIWTKVEKVFTWYSSHHPHPRAQGPLQCGQTLIRSCLSHTPKVKIQEEMHLFRFQIPTMAPMIWFDLLLPWLPPTPTTHPPTKEPTKAPMQSESWSQSPLPSKHPVKPRKTIKSNEKKEKLKKTIEFMSHTSFGNSTAAFTPIASYIVWGHLVAFIRKYKYQFFLITDKAQSQAGLHKNNGTGLHQFIHFSPSSIHFR